jgi:1-hydroxycarotenoid 3,4-desaturase
MQRLADALAMLATTKGVVFRYGTQVDEITVKGGRATGVRIGPEQIEADALIINADTAALTHGLFGRAAARAMPDTKAPRSLSAVTWAMVAVTDGFPLERHNIFFSNDYAAEFNAIFSRNTLPEAPTIYVCAQDRPSPYHTGPERLLCLINAPATQRPFHATEINPCTTRMLQHLERCGLHIKPALTQITTPENFARLFPGTSGALYGPAMHSTMAPFRRPGSRSKIPNLYLAGGSTHPGAGVPMAALSGRLAAASVLSDLSSTRPSRRGATNGGMSMR